MRLDVAALCGAVVVACFVGGGVVRAQETAKLVYDVSTVKPHDPGDQNMRWRTIDERFEATNVVLKSLIGTAWGLRPDQVSGEPAWADDEHWDVTGKVVEADPAAIGKLGREDRNRMLQGLLADRFHLKAHLETRTGPVFNLLPAKGGVKLVLLPAPKADEPKPELRPGMPFDPAHMPPGSFRGGAAPGGAFELQGFAVDMKDLTANIAANMQQTVIDKTGLPPEARFNFRLQYARESVANGTAESDAPPLRDAVEQQLGLHLESTRGPVQVIVVDHVERPTAN